MNETFTNAHTRDLWCMWSLPCVNCELIVSVP